MLEKMGFPHAVIDYIMTCVSTVSYSFLLNGMQFGSLKPARGLRQGDPLSPYFFLFYVEAFIQMIHHAVASNRLKGVRIAPSVPMISNLCFAEDTILFCRASVLNSEEVLPKLILFSFGCVPYSLILSP